jgi:4-amino-4-deoxy-L-arabinose transferase-like glycosyltransferase
MTVVDAAPIGDPVPTPPHPAHATRTGIPLARLWRGRADDPSWVRPTLLALLIGTGVLYVWGLSASGWANSYYSAAVQAGTRSWKAFLFGSTDAGNFITVDKTPASLWPSELAARVFGLSSWSLLLPQALEGVATVGVVYLAVRRWFGGPAGLLAGVVTAATPAAALSFRYNNPDALLVLCMVLGAYFVTRAIEDGRLRWMVLTGAAVGIAFLAKELQAFLVLPGFALGYLVAAPGSRGRRLGHLVAMGVSTLVAAGWFVAILVLTPAASRPYIGGSQNNSFWNVLFGYNGFGRLTGNEAGSVGGRGPGGGGRQWGPTGLTRLFNSSFGDGASWLVPAALVLLVSVLLLGLRAQRTDRTRAALTVWGGWLVITALAFSLGKGIIHEYYTVALAPALGAVAAIGTVTLWRRREWIAARLVLATALGVTAWWTAVLVHRSPGWHDGLAEVVIIGSALVAIGLLVGGGRRILVAVLGGLGIVLALAGPVAASITTARTAHTGPLPTAGPTVTGGGLGPGGGTGLGRLAAPRFGADGTAGGPGGGGGFPGFPGGGPVGPNPLSGGPGQGAAAFRGGPGGSGPFASPEPPAAVTKALQQARDHGERWAAATVGATNAAGYQIASGEPILAMGGFNGSDPTPTLGQFRAAVRDGEIRYFLAGRSGLPGGGRSGPDAGFPAITRWVQRHFASESVRGVTLYDLRRPLASGGARGSVSSSPLL